MTEERQRVKHDDNLDAMEQKWLDKGLKVVLNAGSYGIYSEFNARERRKGETTQVLVHGREGSFSDRVEAPEDAGRYCFPPFASCITGAARLMLAILERLVTDAGGTWAFCDTDSMAIVSTEQGGVMPCPGGTYRMPDGTDAIRVLSHEQVEAIRSRLNRLNPFDLAVVPDILKLEAEATCLAISVKRYALFDLDDRGDPIFLDGHQPSENGLGHFLNPDDPGSPNKEWVKEILAHTHSACARPRVRDAALDQPPHHGAHDRVLRRQCNEPSAI